MKNRELIKIFKAMGNERRLEILRRITKSKQMSVGNLSEIMELSFRSVSKHLSVLSGAGLVEAKQVGLSRYYSISPDFPQKFKEFLES